MNHGEKKNEIVIDISENEIQKHIYNVRGVSIMLDKDLALLYGVETRVLNQAVNRNKERFPEDFMFRLTKEDCLKSQIVILNGEGRGKHFKYMPYAFTENGIAMLSGVLRSKIAIEINIRIMRAFSTLRNLMQINNQISCRIDLVEKRQSITEEKVDRILKRLCEMDMPLQGVFFEGQLWDACSLVEKLIARAKSSILLIDNWISIETLDMLAKKNSGVAVSIVSSKHGNKLASSDIAKFNTQYPTLTIKESAAFHDRFLILDDKEIYLIGASLKDLGKKCFAFTKMDASTISDIKLHI